MTRSIVATVALVAALGSAVAAQAHPRFVASAPERGATVAASPKEVRVSFSEAVRAEGSTFTVKDAQGRVIKAGRLSRAPDGVTIVLPLAARLGPGAYTVEWRVTASGHSSVPGRYRFTVGR